MARTIIVEPGQCLEDIALQEYGSIDGVHQVVMDNESQFPDGFSTRLDPGTELTIQDEPIDRVAYGLIKKLGVVPATLGDPGPDPIGPDGDYDDSDYNNDHFISNS